MPAVGKMVEPRSASAATHSSSAPRNALQHPFKCKVASDIGSRHESQVVLPFWLLLRHGKLEEAGYFGGAVLF